MSSSDKDLRIVVFPALSRPSTHIRTLFVMAGFLANMVLKMLAVLSITENIGLFDKFY
jgi:hypothetical protein